MISINLIYFPSRWIALVGSAAMLFQYLAAPKYCVFTYSAINIDTFFLYILFGAHELLFIFHGWQFYGGIIYVSSNLGAEIHLCLRFLREALVTSRTTNRRVIYSASGCTPNEISLINDAEIWDTDSLSRDRKASSLPKINSSPLNSIITEYRKLTIFSDQLNDYASYNFLVIHVLAYCQMISDVFVMIQLLRMPETDVVGIIFFAEDAFVSKYVNKRTMRKN